MEVETKRVSGFASGFAPGHELASHRFTTLDGMRGIAAMMVVVYHIYGNLAAEAAQWLPKALDVAMKHGYLGVQIFFVLSGYAIGSSFANSRVGGRYVGLFALRRSIRLDPPYWASILVAVLLSILAMRFVPGVDKSLPSLEQIIAHVFYVQNLLEMGDIVPIYWTLCLEIQFYLVLALALYVLQMAIGARNVADVLANGPAKVAGILLLSWSLLTYIHVLPEPHPGTFIPFWFYFFLGLTVYWYSRRWVGAGFVTACFLIVALGIAERPVNISAGLLTAAFLLFVLEGRWITLPLSGFVNQYLGRISYSLYLLHPTIGWSTVSVTKRVLDAEFGIFAWSIVFLTGVVASVVAAHLMNRFLERPSQAFSRRIRVST